MGATLQGCSFSSSQSGNHQYGSRRSSNFGLETMVLKVHVGKLVDIGRPKAYGFDGFRHLCGSASGRAMQLSLFVQVHFGGRGGWTETVEALEGGEADFRTDLVFVVNRKLLSNPSHSLLLDQVDHNRTVNVDVFHRRPTKSGVRGEALLGSTAFEIGYSEMCGTKTELNLDIERKTQVKGSLSLSFSVQPEQEAYSIISTPSEHTVSELADALAHILAGEDGLDILYDCLPRALVPDGDREDVRAELQCLLVSLCNQVGMLSGDSDSESLERLARLSHSIQSYVAACLSHKKQVGKPEVPQVDVSHYAEEWIRSVFAKCVKQSEFLEGHLPSLRDDRIHHFLQAGRQYPSLLELVPIDAHGIECHSSGISLAAPMASILGNGAQGEVWRARHTRTGFTYAVKTSFFRYSRVDRREREMVDHLLMAPHPCIVHLYGAFVYHGKSFVVMELCQGNLHDWICKYTETVEANGNPHFAPPQAQKMFGQIFLALEHINVKLKALIRDMKPHNILIGDGGRLKLTDFGHGRIGTRASGDYTLHCGPPGSKHFVAPEVVLRKPYTSKADIYSLGVLLWCLLTGGLRRTPGLPPVKTMKHPQDFEALSQNSKVIVQAIFYPQSTGARPLPDRWCRELVLKMIRMDPDRRASHEKIRAHRWMLPLSLPAQGAPSKIIEKWLRETHSSSRLTSGGGEGLSLLSTSCSALPSVGSLGSTLAGLLEEGMEDLPSTTEEKNCSSSNNNNSSLIVASHENLRKLLLTRPVSAPTFPVAASDTHSIAGESQPEDEASPPTSPSAPLLA